MFQSTHPGWGATFISFVFLLSQWLFQSTHPGWGATILNVFTWQHTLVSIHAPRVGCDSIKRKGLKVRVICGTFCERIGVDFL